MNNPESSPYWDNSRLWKQWLNYGVNISTPLEVDFDFYSVNREPAEALFQSLEKSALKPEIHKRRKGLFSSWWSVHITLPPQPWDLSKLNEHAQKFVKLADEHGCELDNIGAMMPRTIR